MTTAKKGIWTPWALVVCYECHGPKFPRTRATANGLENYDHELLASEWIEATTPKEIMEDYDVTFCDQCGQAIQTYRSVANEHNMVKKLREAGKHAEMWQTGGMCSGVGIIRKFDRLLDEGEESPHYLATYDFDGDGLWLFGKYDENGEWIEDSEDAPVIKTFDEAFKYIMSFDDVAEYKGDVQNDTQA